MKSREILSGGVFFLFGALTTILSAQMSIGNFRAAGPGLFPLCLGIFLMVLSAGLMVKVLLPAKEHGAEQTEGTIAEDACAKEEPGSLLPVVVFLAIMALAVLLLEPLGYLVVSFLLMVGLLMTLGLRRWPTILVLSLVIAAGSHVLFVYFLRIPLPKGFLGI